LFSLSETFQKTQATGEDKYSAWEIAYIKIEKKQITYGSYMFRIIYFKRRN